VSQGFTEAVAEQAALAWSRSNVVEPLAGGTAARFVKRIN